MLTSIPRECDQSSADECSQPADRREDGVTDHAVAGGVVEQEPVGPTDGERSQDPDSDEGELELQEFDTAA